MERGMIRRIQSGRSARIMRKADASLCAFAGISRSHSGMHLLVLDIYTTQ